MAKRIKSSMSLFYTLVLIFSFTKCAGMTDIFIKSLDVLIENEEFNVDSKDDVVDNQGDAESKPRNDKSDEKTQKQDAEVKNNNNNNDDDNDGIEDAVDNCPQVSNPFQENTYGDDSGDACEYNPEDPSANDADGDGIDDSVDNCLALYNPDQLGNDCTPPSEEIPSDQDGDGVADSLDNCADVANPDQNNSDTDLLGDLCDNCPLISNSLQENTYGSESGDACEEPSNTNGNDNYLTPTPTIELICISDEDSNLYSAGFFASRITILGSTYTTYVIEVTRNSGYAYYELVKGNPDISLWSLYGYYELTVNGQNQPSLIEPQGYYISGVSGNSVNFFIDSATWDGRDDYTMDNAIIVRVKGFDSNNNASDWSAYFGPLTPADAFCSTNGDIPPPQPPVGPPPPVGQPPVDTGNSNSGSGNVYGGSPTGDQSASVANNNGNSTVPLPQTLNTQQLNNSNTVRRRTSTISTRLH